MKFIYYKYINLKRRVIAYIILLLLVSTIINSRNEILLNMKTQYLNKISNNKTSTNNYSFPIDIVYTWVDGRDPKWLDEFKKAKEEKKIFFDKQDFLNRYVDIDELRYSLRSVERNVPWVHNIFIVTWNQIPNWINKSHSKLKFISHSQIFPNNYRMPAFNSNSIEFLLYKIPELSEHFIYINDDMYFGQPVKPRDFFTHDGKNKVISNKVIRPNIDHDNQEWMRKSLYHLGGNSIFNAFASHTIISFRNKYHKVIPYEYSHIPFSMTKSICKDVYLNFKDEIDKTIENRFRDANDLHMQTLMIQYGLFTNQSVVVKKDSNSVMFIVSEHDRSNIFQLSKIVFKIPKLLSINVDDSSNRESIRGLLDFLFDQPSSFELPDKLPNIRPDQKKIWIKYCNRQKQRKYRQNN